ncbi:MAG: tRNA (N6-threonylcarbamoyladenosine(37)-N6)-methyltransferase TrmO [Chloroflexota bacterium]
MRPDEYASRTVRPIGVVRNDVEGPERPDWTGVVSDLVIDARWTEALDGIEHLEKLAVLWWFARREGDEVPTKVHPKGDPNNALTGLFSTRAPIRPNLIALTTVVVLGRDENVIQVQGLDAFNGSPIIDLKPA